MKRQRNDKKLIKNFLKYFKPYYLQCIALLFFILVNLAFSLIQPIVWANLLTTLFGNSFDALKKTLLLLAILYFGVTGINYIQSIMTAQLSNKLVFDMQNNMFNKLLSMKMEYFDQNPNGALISKIVMDINQIVDLVIKQIIPAIMNIIKVLLLFFIMARLNGWLTLVTVGLMPGILYVYSHKTKIMREKQNSVREANDNIIGVIQQTTLGIRDIKLLGLKNVQEKLFVQKNLDKTKKTFGFTVFLLTFQAIISCIGIFGELSVFILGSYFVLKSVITVASFVQFTSYSQQFSSSSISLITIVSDYQKIMVSLKRLAEIENIINAEHEYYGAADIDESVDSIELENVTYRYEDKAIFEHASISIQANAMSIFVGKSGAGKTTMLSLLSGLYSLEEGNIKINGTNIRNYSEESLRNIISSVSQKPYLFNSSIKDNFVYVNPDIRMEEIIEICQMCDIHETICSLPGQYETVIQENGSNLSVGQLQRLGIARAIAKKTPIILLDEPTSALDKQSADIIKNMLKKLKKTKTILLVSHSEDLIMNSDYVYEINDGTIKMI